MALYQGYFKPKNPQKYRGKNPTDIVYRSRWEYLIMERLDADPQVVWWSSEEFIVPYRSPLDGRVHRYFPDMVYHKVDKFGKRKTIMVEIKPYKQTVPPAVSKKKTKRYITEVATWGVNQAKWAAAELYCKERGWVFVKITERDVPQFNINNKITK